jgi:hypothetical protein
MGFPFVLLLTALLARAETGDLTFKIPVVKTSVNLEGQPIDLALWGTVSSRNAAAGVFQLAMTADLAGLQENLIAVLGAQLNQSEKCGNRLTVDRAVLTPAAPIADLTAYVHYERYACVKALGKVIVKRLVGGNGVVEVNLSPQLDAGQIGLAAHVVKIDADGSLGDVLRSGSFGDSVREKIRTTIERAIRKSANLKSVLPPEMGNVATIQSLQFADGGAGKLWLTINAEVRVAEEQLRAVAKSAAWLPARASN